MLNVAESPNGNCEKSYKKSLGVFYSPKPLTDLLSTWAIVSKNNYILEPSFGGCEFLLSAYERLIALGGYHAKQQIYGCDIDNKAFNHLSEKAQHIIEMNNFKEADFLSLDKKDLHKRGFDVVLANPPYVSLHNMNSKQKKTISDIQWPPDLNISKRASLWLYFFLHTRKFVREGAREAWVFPKSFIYSDYSHTLREYISKHFDKSLILFLRTRIFKSQGADEGTIIFLADGWRSAITQGHLTFCEAASIEEISVQIEKWKNAPTNLSQVRKSNIKHYFLPPDSLKVYEKIISKPNVVSLGDLAQVKIGLVTGANSFFVLSAQEAKRLNLQSNVKPILSKLTNNHILSLTKQSHKTETKDVARNMLVVCGEDYNIKFSPLRSYYATFDRHKRRTNKTFKKRKQWYNAWDENIPDAFLSYMCDNGPSLLLNTAGFNCTNTIHRVYFNAEMDLSAQKLLALSMLSTFSQLSAEIEGRSYGSGVLKLEPSAAKRIKVFLPKSWAKEKIEQLFRDVKETVKQHGIDEARHMVDEALFPKMSLQQIEELEEGLMNARALRKPYRNG